MRKRVEMWFMKGLVGTVDIAGTTWKSCMLTRKVIYRWGGQRAQSLEAALSCRQCDSRIGSCFVLSTRYITPATRRISVAHSIATPPNPHAIPPSRTPNQSLRKPQTNGACERRCQYSDQCHELPRSRLESLSVDDLGREPIVVPRKRDPRVPRMEPIH